MRFQRSPASSGGVMFHHTSPSSGRVSDSSQHESPSPANQGGYHNKVNSGEMNKQQEGVATYSEILVPSSRTNRRVPGHSRNNSGDSLRSVDLKKQSKEESIGKGTSMDNVEPKANVSGSLAGTRPSSSTVYDGSNPSRLSSQASYSYTSGGSSQSSSAASSHQVSRSNSAYSSHAISEASSRAISPQREAPVQVQAQPLNAQPQPLVQAYLAQAQGLVTHVSQAVGSLSFTGMKKSTSRDSMHEDGEYVQVRSKQRLRPNPHHFTFSEKDIMKSFLRSAERDRQRAEREAEKLREASMRFAAEQEEVRRRQAAQAIAEVKEREELAAYHYQAAKEAYDRVGDSALSTDSSSEESDDEYAPRRRRPLPVPVHFRFSANDVSKSLSKPFQRQNIGHWTTFPKSSTQMLTTQQLKAWLQVVAETKMREERERETEKERQRELEREKRREHMERHAQPGQRSAPTSPLQSGSNVSFDAASLTARIVSQQRAASSRRGSFPQTQLNSPTPLYPSQQLTQAQPRNNSARPAHSRSNTVGTLFPDHSAYVGLWPSGLGDSNNKPKVAGTVASSKDTVVVNEKSVRSSSFVAGCEKSIHIRRISSGSASQLPMMNSTSNNAITVANHSTAMPNRVPSDSNLYATMHQLYTTGTSTVSKRATMPSKVFATAMQQQLASQPQPPLTQTTASSSSSQSSRRSHLLSSSRQTAQFGSPPLQSSNIRKLLNTNESKSESGHTSPVLPTKSLLGAAPKDPSYYWSNGTHSGAQYDSSSKLGGDVYAQGQQALHGAQRVLNGLYKDVHAQGYGNRSTRT